MGQANMRPSQSSDNWVGNWATMAARKESGVKTYYERNKPGEIAVKEAQNRKRLEMLEESRVLEGELKEVWD